MTWSAPGPRNPSKDGIQRHDVSEPAIERFSVPAGQTPFNPPSDGRPQQDSNLRSRLRSPAARSSEFAASTCVDSIAHLACDGGNSAYIPDHGNCTVTACTLHGMARVRSGQAPAWPLVSGRSVRSGSRVKRDFPCTLTGALPPALVVLRAQSRLRLEGRVRTLSGPSPDPSPARTLAPSGVRGVVDQVVTVKFGCGLSLTQ